MTLTAYQNMAFALKARRRPKAEVKATVRRPSLRVELRTEIRRLHAELAATFLYVTRRALDVGPPPAAMVAALDGRTPAVAGESLALSVDPAWIRLFHPETGVAI
jgi:hypothetical protein